MKMKTALFTYAKLNGALTETQVLMLPGQNARKTFLQAAVLRVAKMQIV